MGGKKLLPVAVATLVLIASGCGYLLGHDARSDLDRARAAGSAEGARIGAEAGHRAGFAIGRARSFEGAYGDAFTTGFTSAYRRAFTLAGEYSPPVRAVSALADPP
jgi:hypothetical protein